MSQPFATSVAMYGRTVTQLSVALSVPIRWKLSKSKAFINLTSPTMLAYKKNKLVLCLNLHPSFENQAGIQKLGEVFVPEHLKWADTKEERDIHVGP